MLCLASYPVRPLLSVARQAALRADWDFYFIAETVIMELSMPLRVNEFPCREWQTLTET